MPWPRTSRHARGYGNAWEKVREEVRERANGMCESCMRKGFVRVGTQCHHKIPKAKRGSDDPGNLAWLCEECHVAADAAAQGRKIKCRVALDGTLIE